MKEKPKSADLLAEADLSRFDKAKRKKKNNKNKGPRQQEGDNKPQKNENRAQNGDDGTIKINGKEVKKILIDGKEFMTGDTKTAMKNLPTSIVNTVKAYDQQSDLSRVTGIDDGEEQTVLDFGVKKGMNKGLFSNIDLGIGTQGRYAERGMAAYFNDKFRMMMFGNANNVNDMGFGGVL